MIFNQSKTSKILLITTLILFISCPFVMDHKSHLLVPIKQQSNHNHSHTPQSNDFVKFSHSEMVDA